MKTLWFSQRIIAWITPISLVVIFILLLFPWVFSPLGSFSAWGLGFNEQFGNAVFIIYDLFIIFAMLTGIASLLMHVRVIPDLPQLEPVKPYRNWIVAFFNLIAFILLAIKVFADLISYGAIPYSFWGLLALEVHFVAAIANLLEICLERRDPSQPMPRIEIKW